MQKSEQLLALIKNEAFIELYRRDFWEFCKYISPGFYKESRPHLKQLCQILDKLYHRTLIHDGKVYTNLQISIPPQHGKSRTLTNFVSWCLGNKNEERVLLSSYNDDTAIDFSQYTRDTINPPDQDEGNKYGEVFPTTRVKHGDSSRKKWSLEGQHFNYKGGGLIGGGFTGKGASILICDDPIKGIEDALNEDHLEKLYRSYVGTFYSRVSGSDSLEDDADIDNSLELLRILNLTRWSNRDLIGRMNKDKDVIWLSDTEYVCGEWYGVSMKVMSKEGDMLCPPMLGKEKYLEIQDKQPPEVHKANYYQEPIEVEGLLFSKPDLNWFEEEEIENIKENSEFKIGYIDVADKGDDFLSFPGAIVVGDKIYITDILFTKSPVEITEGLCVAMINDNNFEMVLVESNAQGRIFGINLQREVGDCRIVPIHNSANKETRILVQSSFIKKNLYFCSNSSNKEYNLFIENLINYTKEGKSKHDDAPDSLAGLVSYIRQYLRHIFT